MMGMRITIPMALALGVGVGVGMGMGMNIENVHLGWPMLAMEAAACSLLARVVHRVLGDRSEVQVLDG